MTPLARCQVEQDGPMYWVIDTQEDKWLKGFFKREDAEAAATAMNAWHEVQKKAVTK